MEITEEKLKEILDERLDEKEDKFQRHVGVLVERFESQTQLIAESVSGIQQQLIAIKEMVAKNTEDIQEMKVEVFSTRKDIEMIKSDIVIIKQNLRRKVDLDDFETLEKRVMFLEKKLATR